jgi:hypothetical protein
LFDCHFERSEKSFFAFSLKVHSWNTRPSSVLGPNFRWWGNHRSAGVGFDDGTFSRTVHQTDGAFGINAPLVDLQKMLRRRRDYHGVDVDFAANHITHAALGAFIVGDF